MKSKTIKSRKSLIVTLLILTLGGILIWGAKLLNSNERSARVQAVSVKTVTSAVMADGVVTAQNQAVMHFQIGGKLVYLPFREGDAVYAGQTIASLNQMTLEKQLNQALNNYRSVRNTFDQNQQNNQDNVFFGAERYQLEVFSRGSGITTGDNENNIISDMAKRILDQNQATLDNSVLNVEIANQALQLATLISPINGIVIHLDVTTSNVNVTPVTSFIVADPSTLVFRANVSENDIPFVTEGADVTLKFGNGNNEIKGNVKKIYPDKITLPAGGSAYRVDISVSNLGEVAKYGQSGIALIATTTVAPIKLVPTWMVLNARSLWVESGGKPVLREVTTGKTYGSFTEILSGLYETDKVILTPKTVIAKNYQIL